MTAPSPSLQGCFSPPPTELRKEFEVRPKRPNRELSDLGGRSELCLGIAGGHIHRFVGPPLRIADTPFIDSNIVHTNAGSLLYPEWPNNQLSQWTPGLSPRRFDVSSLGVGVRNWTAPVGLAVIPAGLPAQGQMRMTTWPDGLWYHVGFGESDGIINFTTLTEILSLPNRAGSFAYVPSGSPGFLKPSILVVEWHEHQPEFDRVVAYELNELGDPIVRTRREFIERFPRPWGSFFDRRTGDYLLVSWGLLQTRIVFSSFEGLVLTWIKSIDRDLVHSDRIARVAPPAGYVARP